MAMSAGPMKQMFEAFLPEGAPMVNFDTKQSKYIDLQ